MRSRSLGLFTGLTMLFVALASTSAFAEDELVASESAFFLRGTGCGATQNFWLSSTSGEDEYDGCGVIGGLPVQEVIHQVDGPSPDTFQAQDGVPVILDASRDVTGQIRAESWFGDAVPGVGQIKVDVELSGSTSKGQFVVIGSHSSEVLNTGAGGTNVPFTIDVPDLSDKVQLSDLTFTVEIHGVNWNSGNLGLSGDSRFTLPTYVVQEVEVIE